MNTPHEESMSFQEKRSLVYLLSTLFVLAGCAWYVFLSDGGDALRTDGAFKPWATFFLLLVPIQIVAHIVSQIIFTIVNTIATREEEPKFEDERDKLIELKASRNAYHSFTACFLLSMVVIVMGGTPFAMFNMMAGGIFLSGITWSISKFYYYRRGF